MDVWNCTEQLQQGFMNSSIETSYGILLTYQTLILFSELSVFSDPIISWTKEEGGPLTSFYLFLVNL